MVMLLSSGLVGTLLHVTITQGQTDKGSVTFQGKGSQVRLTGFSPATAHVYFSCQPTCQTTCRARPDVNRTRRAMSPWA